MTPFKTFTFCSIIFISLLATIYSCSKKSTNGSDKTCTTLVGLDTLLRAGQLILLGEIHGTQEGPGFVERIACLAMKNNLNVTIGLELPQSEEAEVQSFLISSGAEADKKKVLNLPFWSQDYQDGRASQAMFSLLETVRTWKAKDNKVDVILIDKPSSDDRDFAMAQRVIEEAERYPSNFMVVLTGNYHNMIFEGAGQMGSYVLTKLGEERVLSLLQSYTGGSAWVDVAGKGFGPVGLGGDGLSQIGVYVDRRMGDYHGTLEIDSIHHSRPAKELLDN
jgi:hypothetical protein